MRRPVMLATLVTTLLASAATAQLKDEFWGIDGGHVTRITIRGRVVTQVERASVEEFKRYLSRRLDDPSISSALDRAGRRAASPAEVADVSEESSDGFRDTRWGMAPEEVTEQFPGILYREGTRPLIGTVQDSLAGRPARLRFLFVDRRLVEVDSEVLGSAASQDDRIQAYDELARLLERKYGPAADKGEVWHKEIYRDQPESWGFALGRGDFERSAIWRTPETEIRLDLSGGNFQVDLTLAYESLADRATRAKRTLANKLDEI